MLKKFFESEKGFNATLATGALLILGIPVAIACILLGFVWGENPCIMCWCERTGMMFLGALLLFMLRYGLRMKYLVAYALWSFFGLYMGLRHTGNLIFRDLGQGFGNAIFNVHTYSWAVFVYWCAVLSIALLLLFIRRGSKAAEDITGIRRIIKPLGKYAKFVVVICFAAVSLNALQAFLENGLPPNLGKGRPARLTFDLANASKDWNGKLWANFLKPASVQGNWSVEKPFIAGVNESGFAFSSDPAAGPIETDPEALEVKQTYALPFAPKGARGLGSVTGIAYNGKLNKFAFVTSNAGVYYTDSDFKKMTDYAIFDYANGNDLVSSVDTTFMGDKLVNMAYNKTIYANELKSPEKIDKWMQWRIFREASASVAPVWGVNRPWLSTARAHLCFVGSETYDDASNTLYSVTVPNKFNKNSILLAFDMADKQVVSERNITAAKNLAVKPDSKLDYYITGAVMHNGKLLALSINHRSLLVIDPAKAEIEKVYGLPANLSAPRSLAIKGNSLFTLDHENGKDVVKEIPMPSNL